MNLRILREAEQEIAEAASFYAREAPGIVGRFFDEVDLALTRLLRQPLAYAAIDRRFRGCVMNRFPFTVIYQIVGDEIVVYAFAHQSRRPAIGGAAFQANRRSVVNPSLVFVVAPGLTVKEWLRVLYTGDSGNYYDAFGLCPSDALRQKLNQAEILVEN